MGIDFLGHIGIILDMKRIFLLILLILPVFAYPQEKVDLTLYYSTTCKRCHDIKNGLLPGIKAKYKDVLNLRQVVTSDNPRGLTELIAVSEKYGRSKALVPTILISDQLLVGSPAIKANLERIIEESVGQEIKPVPEDTSNDVDIIKVFNKIPLLVIIVSGLIDGINPCAFAVIVFFVSFLAVYGYKKREIIYVGSTYCISVFIAYFLIGLGLFKALYSLSHFYIAIKSFYILVAFICFLFAGFALFDYFKYKKTGESKDQLLQLPDFLKKRINKVIGSQLRDKRGKTPFRLIISSFIVGFIVSLLEAVCTGQVYVPVIAAILKYPHLRLKALFYLFIYNLMFILPLIIIFVLSLLGFSSERFNKFLKKHLGLIKILMAILFIGLGVFVIGYDQIHIKLLPFFKEIILKCLKRG